MLKPIGAQVPYNGFIHSKFNDIEPQAQPAKKSETGSLAG